MPKFAKSVVFDHEDRLLLVKRSEHMHFLRGAWEIPGGMVDPKETSLEAAKRELKEETGLELDHHFPHPIHSYRFLLQEKVGRVHASVLAYLMKRAINPRVVLNPHEHAEFAWVHEHELGNYQMNAKNMELARIAFKHLKKVA